LGNFCYRVFDSDDVTNGTGWNSSGEKLTSWKFEVQPNHFIVLENTSGASSRDIRVTGGNTGTFEAIVIEQAP